MKTQKKNYKKYKRNPATKTFQAIRIFVNQELTELILGLIEAAKLLSNGGVLIVVSFHSLEDKIVKNFFNLYSNLRKNIQFRVSARSPAPLPIVILDRSLRRGASRRVAHHGRSSRAGFPRDPRIRPDANKHGRHED